MEYSWSETFLNPILTYISIQLFVISFFHLFKKKTLEIGIICLILASNNVYSHFFETLYRNFLANILFADYRSILIPSLLYIYLTKKTDAYTKKKYHKHLIIPLLPLITYITIKFTAPNFYDTSSFISPTYWCLSFCVMVYYFYLSYKLLYNLKDSLLKDVYRRYLVIVTIVCSNILLSIIQISIVFYLRLNPENTFLRATINPYIIKLISLNFILIFSLLELDILKKYFLGNSLYNQYDLIKNENLIKTFLEKEIIANKLFTHNDFNIKISLRNNNINEKEFRLYLKKEFKMTINDYMNKLKIDEFVAICKTTDFSKYNIDGLSEMAGFKSKATFYRVFKKYYTITPVEYLKQKTL